MANRPRSREKRVTGGSVGVHKRGSGLGSGPVGGGYSGRGGGASGGGMRSSGGRSPLSIIIILIIALLGGRENITLVDACMTRLRVTVKDLDKVADLAAWKAEGALGLIKKDNGIQAVYGPKADVLKSDINDIL